MTSLRYLIVVGLFGLAPVLCNGDELTCGERCQNKYGYFNGEEGSRISVAIGAINDNGGPKICECRINHVLENLLITQKLDVVQFKKMLKNAQKQTSKSVRSWLKEHAGVEVHLLGAEELNKSPNTGPDTSGKEKNPEHVLREDKCKDKCRKEAGYRFAETKDKVVRAWITEGYYNHTLVGPEQCECKSSEVLMNYLHHKRINTQEFELLRVQRKWEKINEWLKKRDLSLIVFGKEKNGGDPIENETSCTEKCRKSHGYIDGETKGSLIFLMTGVLNNNKFIMVHGEKQRDLVDCECQINPILKNLLISKRLNVEEFKEKNNEYEADKWLLDHMGKQVHFLEPKKSSKGLFGIKLRVTKEECEEQCFEKKGYVELGPRLHLKVAKGQVVVSCMRSKCECKINEGLLAYLEKEGFDLEDFLISYRKGDAGKWFGDNEMNIKFPVSSRNREKQPKFPVKQRHQHPSPPAEQEHHPLSPPREQKHPHLPKQKNSHSTSPTDQTHHHLPPLPGQKHQLSPPLAAHEHESEQCRLSPSTETIKCTHLCEKSYGYITGGDSNSKIYITIGIIVTKDRANKKAQKTVCDCLPNEKLRPILKEGLYESFETAWKSNIEDGWKVLREHNFEVLYDLPETKNKNSSKYTNYEKQKQNKSKD